MDVHTHTHTNTRGHSHTQTCIDNHRHIQNFVFAHSWCLLTIMEAVFLPQTFKASPQSVRSMVFETTLHQHASEAQLTYLRLATRLYEMFKYLLNPLFLSDKPSCVFPMLFGLVVSYPKEAWIYVRELSLHFDRTPLSRFS